MSEQDRPEWIQFVLNGGKQAFSAHLAEFDYFELDPDDDRESFDEVVEDIIEDFSSIQTLFGGTLSKADARRAVEELVAWDWKQRPIETFADATVDELNQAADGMAINAVVEVGTAIAWLGMERPEKIPELVRPYLAELENEAKAFRVMCHLPED